MKLILHWLDENGLCLCGNEKGMGALAIEFVTCRICLRLLKKLVLYDR